jgi:SOS response regulatory protein OraA/RecX
MSRKKLSREDLDHGISTAFEQMPEDELIDAAIEKRIRLKGIPQTREATKKFYDHLMRQGFEYGMIRTKMSDLSKREE